MENKTDYQLAASMNKGIMEVVITGEIALQAIPKLQNEVVDITRTLNAKDLIVDVRALKGRFGSTEAYYRVRNYPPDRTNVKTAVVDNPENGLYQSFHETTAINAGLSMKCFTNIGAARAWFKKGKKKQ